MLPSLSPDQTVEVKSAIKEAAGSLTRIAAERDLQKDIKSNMKDDFEIEPKLFNSLVKAYYEQNLNEVRANTDDLIESYEELFGEKE